jgi:hypothetical protein
MTMNLPTNGKHPLICKPLPELPPVVTDWQQVCEQPRCPYYGQGECCHPGRQRASAACPFDGKGLPLGDAGAATVLDSPACRKMDRFRHPM